MIKKQLKMTKTKSNKYATGIKRHTKRSNAENGDFDLEKVKSMQVGKKSLRIDSKTVILVRPEKCNEKYAFDYKQRMNKYQ